MGAISSCCATEAADSKEAIPADATETKEDNESYPLGSAPPRAPAAATTKLSDSDLNAFQKRLEQTMEVIVLLADGTRLTCDLKLNTPGKALVISCDIPLTDLKAILHGKDQLRRVETKANLTDDPNCIALHMMTGNCIPIRFETQNDKDAFIELLKKLK